MKNIILIFLAMSFFIGCNNDSPGLTDTQIESSDVENNNVEQSEESVDSLNDEINDEASDETGDEFVDEITDEIHDGSADEEVDAYPDEYVDEYIPDEDYLFEAPDSMVLIPAGEFWMGAPEEEEGRYWNEVTYDELLHYVLLTKGFYMDKHEVTQEDFEELMGYNPSYYGYNVLDICGSDCPVETVNWYEAAEYANSKSEEFGLEQCFECKIIEDDLFCELKDIFSKPQDCRGFRLPTEAEWEYAARAGTTSAFYSGDMLYTEMEPLDTNLDEIAWYAGNSGAEENGYVCYEFTYCSTNPVGKKLPNKFGLYDMSGNVAEWTMDWYRGYPEGTPKYPVIDPWAQIQGTNRIYRGGSHYTDSFICRSAYRSSYGKGGDKSSSIGFRLVKTE
jgi:formylglycine-generating enzyme required for sulfatase activity